MKAVILSGGKGSRLKPLTDTIPKALVEVGSKSLIEYALDSLPNEIDTVFITTKYLGEKIEQRIGNNYFNKKIFYIEQPKDMEGTWSAVFGVKNLFEKDEKFLILNCDDVFDKKELEDFISSKENKMGVTERIMPAKYHGINIDNDGYVHGFRRHENKDREELVKDIFANGLFLLDQKIFNFDPVKLIDGEYGLPQTIMNNKDDYPLKSFKIKKWFPCNSFEDLEKLKEGF